MKKLALVLGAAGFLLTVGAAGGADSAPFGVTALCVALGIALLFASERVYISKIRIRAFKKTARRVRPQKAKAVPAARKAPAKPVCRVKEALADMETA